MGVGQRFLRDLQALIPEIEEAVRQRRGVRIELMYDANKGIQRETKLTKFGVPQ